jgi:hypothetical protein
LANQDQRNGKKLKEKTSFFSKIIMAVLENVEEAV